MLNIVIPMAGRGSRFVLAGYTDPKPFISVGGNPMIELVIRNLRPARPHRFIFVCQQAHLNRYNYSSRLQILAPGCEIIGLPELTEGAACTVLLAASLIDNNQPLMIANADQWVNIDINNFLAKADQLRTDGLIMTLTAVDPKWSYVQRDRQGHVCRVVEKEVVSDEATVGIYHFRRGLDFCRQAREMVASGDRSLGEYYVAPVYTRMYANGLRNIDTYHVGSEMYGLGTPQDLTVFLDSPALALAKDGMSQGVA